MVERRIETVNVSGEWYTPHVIEPAFVLIELYACTEHAYEEVEKEGEAYTFL